MSIVTTDVIKVTPKMARELLETSTVNRRLRRALVASFRNDMEQGRWLMTGEPIKISRTRALLDGQHRLTALAESEGVRHIEFLVVRGLADEVQAVMDSGAPRSLVNAIEWKYGKVTNLAVQAALARWLAVVPVPVPEMNSVLGKKVTNALALETYASNPDIPKAAQQGTHIRTVCRGLSPSAFGYSWLQLHRADPEACSQYFWSWESMQFNQGVHDPRLAAWRRMQVMVEESANADTKLAVAIISVITRSWNAWRKGEELSTITYKGRYGTIGPVRPLGRDDA